MTWNWDLVSVLNLILSLAILVIGCWDYARTKKQAPFFIGVAFGLFSISHLITIMGVEKNFEFTVMLIRIFGYLIVTSALFKMRKEG